MGIGQLFDVSHRVTCMADCSNTGHCRDCGRFVCVGCEALVYREAGAYLCEDCGRGAFDLLAIGKPRWMEQDDYLGEFYPEVWVERLNLATTWANRQKG